ncbi:protein PHLOEM PROTEIN 2-LIKE A10-like [Carica papaya]|uniref:protein PHLOEM PROTEIN 2-LIKE A10-like n=1 Tax=Carica papaya TaxID=3649 RepID=UPI000B8CE5D8|nr:protein PHLOEM PROTEIN 2-LIKE A10-like [Carica papaya]
MDLQLVKKGLSFARKNKKWVLLLTAFGFTSYGVYNVYYSPEVAQKRRRISKLFEAMISLAEAVSESAGAISIVSRDLKDFLRSESDQIPNSLTQISKVTNSDEFSISLTRFTQALTFGLLRGYRSELRKNDSIKADSSFLDQAIDKLFTKAGSGFASVVVGSFARNLVMAFYLDGSDSNSTNSVGLNLDSAERWVNLVSSNQCRKLIVECIQMFVSTAVAVYLDKTMHINTYDEFFAGMTNPKHERKVRDMMVTVCNGAIETLVKTSHQEITSSMDGGPVADKDELLVLPELKANHLVKKRSLVGKLSSALALPKNRRVLLDLAGEITFETVRSFLEFLLERICDGIRRILKLVHETVAEAGIETVRYVNAKSSAMVTVCLSMCLDILDGAWISMLA